MQLKSHELGAHLNSALGCCYLFHGAEPLLIEDSITQLRQAALRQGFDERLSFTMEPGFDWSQFAGEFDSLSLFSQKKIIELRLPTGKPGVKGAQILADLAARQMDETILLVACAKLEAATKNASWIKQFVQHGVVTEHYAIAPAQLLNWINARAGQYQLRIDTDARRLLAYYLEGNLLAIDQELKKFALLGSQKSIHVSDIQKSVEDSARFNVYNFVDAALVGQLKRALRMLASLKAEGVEPVIINWALAREVRQLLEMSAQIEQGGSMPAVLKQHRVWSSRARIVEAALKRLKSDQWKSIHYRLTVLDRIIKGRASAVMQANIWTEYERIICRLC